MWLLKFISVNRYWPLLYNTYLDEVGVLISFLEHIFRTSGNTKIRKQVRQDATGHLIQKAFTLFVLFKEHNNQNWS